MPDINSAIEDYLASMPDDDWTALCARVRPPAADPKQEAVDALRRRVRGANVTELDAKSVEASKKALNKIFGGKATNDD